MSICEFLIGYSDYDLGSFDLQGEILELALEDIYFIVGLSRRGAPVNLEGTGRCNDLLSVQDYIIIYYMPGTQKMGTCIPLAHIHIFPLPLLVSTVVRVAGSSSLHIATRN